MCQDTENIVPLSARAAVSVGLEVHLNSYSSSTGKRLPK